MDKQFLKRLQTFNRREEVRSSLLIEGVKRTLKQKKEMSLIGRFFYNKRKRVIAKGWN